MNDGTIGFDQDVSIAAGANKELTINFDGVGMNMYVEVTFGGGTAGYGFTYMNDASPITLALNSSGDLRDPNF